KVVWVPWRRPGFQLGLDIAAIKARNPHAIGCILGGHGITAWGQTSAETEKNSRWIISTAQTYIDTHGKVHPFGQPTSDRAPLDPPGRRAKAALLVPTIRSSASRARTMVGHFTDDARVLEFLGSANAARLAAMGTSCPDHLLRTKV